MIPLLILSLIALLLGFLPAYFIFPRFIAATRGDRLLALACVINEPAGSPMMKRSGNVGVDPNDRQSRSFSPRSCRRGMTCGVNKKGKPLVAEMGGNSALSAETQHALQGVLSFPN